MSAIFRKSIQEAIDAGNEEILQYQDAQVDTWIDDLMLESVKCHAASSTIICHPDHYAYGLTKRRNLYNDDSWSMIKLFTD